MNSGANDAIGTFSNYIEYLVGRALNTEREMSMYALNLE